jgi:hypothetical protein
MAFEWTNLIAPALQAGGAYLQYNDKKERGKDLDRQYQAYLDARELQAQANASRGRSGGGGGGGNKTAAAQMMADYIKQAQARYEPYMRMANEVLPKQTELYASALPGAQNFVSSMLSPENIADMMRYDRPVQPDLPDYLAGGKK